MLIIHVLIILRNYPALLNRPNIDK